jgi:hypothetical protein
MLSENLKKEYENIINKYIDAFCEKQKIDKYKTHWIGDEVGGLFDVADCTFDFLDIKRDIETNQPKHKIFKWYLENDYINNKIINYQSYLMGLRVKDLNKNPYVKKQTM